MGKGSGRNLPCPCGSGNKYKNCCFLTTKIENDNIPNHLGVLKAKIKATLGEDYVDIESFLKAYCWTVFRLAWKAYLNPDERITNYDLTENLFRLRVYDLFINLRGKLNVSRKDLEELVRLTFHAKGDLTQRIDYSSISSFEKYEDWVEKFWIDDLFARRMNFSDESNKILSAFKGAWHDYLPKIKALTPKLIHSVKDVYYEYIEWLKKHPEVLDDIAWEAFEKIVAEIFENRGFQIDLTGRVRNKSADIIALRTDELGIETKYLVECKRYSKSRKVGLDIVNAVIGAKQRANVDHAILVTTSAFTNDVMLQNQRLEDLRLHLRDGRQFYEWLKEYREESKHGIHFLDGWDSI
jgi:hypothetical protein